MTAVRPRVALVSPYWTFFEDAVGIDLRADRAALLRAAGRDVAACAEVVMSELVEPGDHPAAVADRVTGTGADVLLVLVTLAAPPATILEVVERLPHLPLVVWAVVPEAAVPLTYSHVDIARHGATVGTPMITSVLVQTGRRFDLVAGPIGARAAVLRRSLSAAGAAALLRRARVGRVGSPIPGYRSVDSPDDRLETVVDTVVRLDPEILRRGAAAVTDHDVRGWLARHRDDYRWDAGSAAGRDRTVRAAIALQRVVDEHGLVAGTLNCHVPEIRGAAEVGSPCFALGACTSVGVPWTCTGDVLTALAMTVANLLTGTSLYHEIEAYDTTADDFLIANSGEHDTRWHTAPLTVQPNPWWSDGLCAQEVLPSAAATLLACCEIPDHRYRLVVAEGAFSGTGAPVGTVNGRFAFDARPGMSGWTAWCQAGAGHHSAAARGRVAGAVELVGRHLGIDVVRV